MQPNILKDFDFSLLDSPDFKEDAVREEIIHPILSELGYSASGLNRIIRSKTLNHPYLKIGSKQRQVQLVPDYLLTVAGKPYWVLDAKAPQENVTAGDHVEQIYSYAIHPEVRVRYFALCNGREFCLFAIDHDTPIMYFHISELQHYWIQFYELLAPQASTPINPITVPEFRNDPFDYNRIIPPGEIKELKKQSASRHYGVHPYFTKQVWNVVQEYIKTFTKPGDLVLDPFGGTGVTLVEALVLGRRAIHIDLNPLSIFFVENLIRPVDLNALAEEYMKIRSAFERNAPSTPDEIDGALSVYLYPKGTPLPKNSDVETIEQLFTQQQLAQLAYLKHLIMNVDDEHVRATLLLMFSGLLNKINLTYHASGERSEGRGDSAIFRYYRYRIAKKPAILDIIPYLDLRYKKIVAAKRELAPYINRQTFGNAQIYRGTATALTNIENETIDYIYTDPPYGSKIPYLDLSVMWNEWLDLPVTQRDRVLEAIEGGELQKTRDDYAALLTKSIEEMFRVLKFDRWMSFVFAHKDPAYWHLIVETAEKIGFEYMGAVSQSNDKISFKKQQNPFTVLSGQLIINFKKVRSPRTVMRVELGSDITNIILETIEGVIARNNGATLEEINDELIIKGLELGFLDILSREYQDISPILYQQFTYDEQTKKFHVKQNSKFKSRIDVRLRIKYYLISYMRRMAHQKYYPTFDDIVLNIMPLLKNGITPEEQTILRVLEDIAMRTTDDRWILRDNQQMELF